MKDLYVKAMQSRRNRGQFGDYMLQSRTPSDVGDPEPMIIEYDDTIDSQPVKNMEGPSVDEVPEEEFKEELMLIQSGNFVLTAPSLAGQIDGVSHGNLNTTNIVEQREEPPEDTYQQIGRSPTNSFEADFTGIEKTYTTFVNVAEDQIYPLEWKFFLEAAMEEPAPKKKGTKSRRTILPKSTKTSNNGENAATTSTATSKKTVPDNTKIEEKDSESMNSKEKRFRLFPNLRDVATRRTKRMEAARNLQRLAEGRRRGKKENKDKNERPKQQNDNKVGVPGKTIQDNINQQAKYDVMPSADPTRLTSTNDANGATSTNTTSIETKKNLYVNDKARALSPPKNDVSLHELAEKILGKEIPRSEAGADVYDFTKSKRKKKKKKPTNEINGSTSFPILSSQDMSWDRPKRDHIESQDDNLVSYDHSGTDAMTVAHGVEAVFSPVENNEESLFLVVEKNPESINISNDSLAQTSTLDVVQNSAATFTLSRSFDDVYHSSLVKSIKKEIEVPVTTNTDLVNLSALSPPPQTEFSLASNSEPAIPQEFKWFNFGRQQNVQQDSVLDNQVEHTTAIASDKNIIDERDDVPVISQSRSLSNIIDVAPDIEGKSPDGLVKNQMSTDHDKVDSDQYENFNSVQVESDDENISVITDRSDKVVSNFFNSFGKLLTLFGRKVKNAVTCAPTKFNTSGYDATLLEDALTYRDDDEESGVVVAERKMSLPQGTQVTTTQGESPLTPTAVDNVPEVEDEALLKKIGVVDKPVVPKRVVSMPSMASKGSSLSIPSQNSSKTYDTDDTETVGSDDDENITTTSSVSADSEEGIEAQWCSCT